MEHVFGPVPSRRLGMSLGVDLIPSKTCTYDCIYCQVGETTCKTITPERFVPVDEVIEEIRRKLLISSPDIITLAGSGEPTLHSGVREVIASIKDMTAIETAVLTNGACLWMDDVRRRVLEADIIMPTLSTVNESTFRLIHRPHKALNLEKVLEGLKKLRKDFFGGLFLEVVLLSGINDSEEELEGLKRFVREINPDRIQLNTVVRPPATNEAKPLSRKKLEEIRSFFGADAEVVGEASDHMESNPDAEVTRELLGMVKRRPLNTADISASLGLEAERVDDLARGLVLKGLLEEKEYSGQKYYVDKDDHIRKGDDGETGR